jgi:PAS domain S-box-containing protein
MPHDKRPNEYAPGRIPEIITKPQDGLSRVPIVAMLAISALLVALMAGLSWKNGRDRILANEESAISRQIQAATEELLSTIKDAETGQRGYLLTGGEQYLEPYNSAAARVAAILSQLRDAASMRPDQSDREKALEPVVLAKMSELAATVDLRRSQGLPPALRVVETDAGKHYMDDIRTQSAAMRDIAARRVATFSAIAETSASRLRIVSTAGSLVLLGFLAISAVTVLRGLAHREDLYHRATSNAELLSVTLSSIGDAVIATDTESRISFINPVAQDLTGWAETDAIGIPIEQVFRIVNEATRAPVPNPAEKAMQTGTIVGLANHTILITRQGKEIPIDDSGSPIRNPDGAVVGAILVFRDISERYQSDKLLKASNEQLQQFVTAAAHDLRAPLNSASVYTELLARQLAGQIDTEGEQTLGYVQSGVRRILRLVDDLLAYAQASHFQPEEDKRTPIENALNTVLENLRSEIEKTGATITADKLSVVAAHEAHMVQLLQNLIGNALKYYGNNPPEVRISCESTDSEWVISVSDNGVGIGPAYTEEIFRPFKRLHGDDRPGSGIGLATCQKIVAGYGGRIWVTSEPGKGSTFFFSLPYRDAGTADGART